MTMRQQLNDAKTQKISEGQQTRFLSTKDEFLYNMTMRQQPNDITNKKISEGQHKVSTKDEFLHYITMRQHPMTLQTKRYLKVNMRFLQKTSFYTI